MPFFSANTGLAVFVVSLLALLGVCRAQNSCCTPAQWQTDATTVSNMGMVTHHIYYDKSNLRVRWDRVGNLEKPGVTQTIITWTDYGVGSPGAHPEYVYFVENNQCFTYGADEWSDWCFGLASEQQSFVGPTAVNGVACSVWSNQLQGFTWVSRNAPCLPVSTMQATARGSVQSTLFSNSTIGIRDSSVFTVPPICKHAKQLNSIEMKEFSQILVRHYSFHLAAAPT